MDKGRVEALSDGVFSIVMTLLIFDVKIATTASVSNAQLWYMIGTLWPLFVSYALSFMVLATAWINHHFLFHSFAKQVNRQLNLINMVYLMFLAFIPFSAQLLGAYTWNQPAVIMYGANLLVITILSAIMQRYVRKHPNLRNDNLSTRIVKQARVRLSLSMISYLLGLVCSLFFIPLSIVLYLFPVVFNIIPGSLNMLERVFGFELA